MWSRFTVLFARAVVGCSVLLLLQACGDRDPSGPTDSVLAAKSGSGVFVGSVDPTEATQDTTLDVVVTGQGFDDGSSVRFLLGGRPTSNITTNSTTYVDGDLNANITIGVDADTALYDVEVTTSRKRRGIGTEMFRVLVGRGKGTVTVTLASGMVGSEGGLPINVDSDNKLETPGPYSVETVLTLTKAFSTNAGTRDQCVFDAPRNSPITREYMEDQLESAGPVEQIGSWVALDRTNLGEPSEVNKVSLNYQDFTMRIGTASQLRRGEHPIISDFTDDGVTMNYTISGGSVVVMWRGGKPKDRVRLVCPNQDAVEVTVVREP